MDNVCKFIFNKAISKEEIEAKIALAIITAECTFGQAKVRLNAAYFATDGKVVIDVSSDVGEHIAQVFTGLATREMGEEAFTVERIRKESIKE